MLSESNRNFPNVCLGLLMPSLLTWVSNNHRSSIIPGSEHSGPGLRPGSKRVALLLMTGQHDSISLDLSPASDLYSTLAYGTCISSDSRMPHAHEESYRSAGAANLNNLPDDIFRGIFACCLSDLYWDHVEHMRTWQRLVRVCQRWRQIIYGSPRYLGLHLHSSFRSSFRKKLSCWPEFPITIDHSISQDRDDDDLIAALEHPDRVLHVTLLIMHSEVTEVLEMMQVPFPALTVLELNGPDSGDEDSIFELPDDFLGGSSPCLHRLRLKDITFPSLPKLLFSARELVSLHLKHIPATGHGHISSEAMIGGLAGLTRLETLSIKFRLPIPPHEQRRRLPDPLIRVVLPALTEFVFLGMNEYLEDLITQIDTPRVKDIRIRSLFTQEVETRQLSQFISHAAVFELAQFRAAHVVFGLHYAFIELDGDERHGAHLSLTMFLQLDFSIPCMARVFGQFVGILSNVVHLSVLGLLDEEFRRDLDSMNNIEWLTILRLFRAVEALYVSGALAVHIASALQDVAEESATEVLPALDLLQLDQGNGPVGPPERFLSLRQLSGFPVTVVLK